MEYRSFGGSGLKVPVLSFGTATFGGVVGARTEAQLKENLGAVGWTLDEGQMARLDTASEVRPIYPYWHQRQFAAINPPPVPVRLKNE